MAVKYPALGQVIGPDDFVNGWFVKVIELPVFDETPLIEPPSAWKTQVTEPSRVPSTRVVCTGAPAAPLTVTVPVALSIVVPNGRLLTVTLFTLGAVRTLPPVLLRASRAMVLRLLETDRLSGDDLDAVKARIAANTHAILDRLTAEARDMS